MVAIESKLLLLDRYHWFLMGFKLVIALSSLFFLFTLGNELLSDRFVWLLFGFKKVIAVPPLIFFYTLSSKFLSNQFLC